MVERLNVESCLNAFERIAPRLVGDGTGWLDSSRRTALSEFEESGFPTIKNEDWKYTDIRPLTRHDYWLEAAVAAQEAGLQVPQIDGLDAIRLVFVNGRFIEQASSRVEELPDGVVVTGLAGQIASDSSIIQSRLGSALPGSGHGFSTLNSAFVNDGLYLYVPEGVHMDRVVEVVFVSSGQEQAPLVQPRNLVALERGARLNLIERYYGESGEKYLSNAVSEIFLAPESRLEYCRLQEESSQAGHIGGLFVRQAAGSQLIANTISLEGALIRNDVRVALDESGAQCRLNGLTVGGGRQHVDNHTHIDHNAERCISRELYKGVLDGRARSVFHGRIVVNKGAQKTDSEQQNHSLLLSRDTEVDTKPQLEIYADDVKCSHGATVGQLDEDSVFYLRSRAIGEATARRLLTYAFAEGAIGEISLAALRAYIERRIHDRLGSTS